MAGFNLRPDGVGQLAHDRPLFRGELAHLLQKGGELAFFAQELHPELLQVRRGDGGVQRRQSPALNVFQLLFHCGQSPLLKARPSGIDEHDAPAASQRQ